MRKVGAFWLKEDKNGVKFFSGTVDEPLEQGTNLLVFKNKWKQEDKHPDYRLFNADAEEEEASQSNDVPF